MIRRGDTRHLVAGLITRTTELGITRQDLAQAIGVGKHTIDAWFRHAFLPKWVHVVAWAERIGLRLAVVAGGTVLSEGARIPGGFDRLRRRQGLTQQAVADRAQVAQVVICRREHLTDPGLAVVHDHVTLLGYQLTLLHAQPLAVAG